MSEQLAVEETPVEAMERTPSGVAGPAPTGQVGLRVAIQGRQVVVIVGNSAIGLMPTQALQLAGLIRGYANRVLHAEHVSLARERRVARGKRRA